MIATLHVLPDRGPVNRVRGHPGTGSLAAMTEIALLPEEERKRRVAYVIATAREKRGMTPPQLAERVGRTRGTVNDWEAGRSTPSLVDLGPLCAALRLEPRAFAELPAIPVDPVAAFLLPAAESGFDEGVRRARRRRATADPGTPAPSPERQPRGTGAGRG